MIIVGDHHNVQTLVSRGERKRERHNCRADGRSTLPLPMDEGLHRVDGWIHSGTWAEEASEKRVICEFSPSLHLLPYSVPALWLTTGPLDFVHLWTFCVELQQQEREKRKSTNEWVRAGKTADDGLDLHTNKGQEKPRYSKEKKDKRVKAATSKSNRQISQSEVCWPEAK